MPTEWTRPTPEQAALFAQCLEAGMAGEDVIGDILTELEGVLRPELARRWEKDARVKAARFDLRAWLAKSGDEKVADALTHAYLVMAYWVRQQTFGMLETQKLSKFLNSLAVLERKQAGSAGKADAVSQFLEQFQKKIASGEVVVKAKAATH